MLCGPAAPWLRSPSPGQPERAEAGPLAGARSRPGRRGGQARGRRWPRGEAWGGPGRRGPSTGRLRKQREPPRECQFGSSAAPRPTQRGLGGPAGPSAFKVLGGRGRPGRAYPDRGEGPGGGTEGSGRGLGRVHMCTHTCMHTGTHMYTLTSARTSTGTPACTQPTRVAAEPWRGWRGPRPRGGSGGGGGLSRARARRRWRRSCPWWARRCQPGSRGPRCPGTSWS